MVLGWSGGAGAGQERSHAAWRSFFSKTMLPMQRGARSGPRGWRQLSARMLLFQWAVLSWSLGGLGVVLGGSWGDLGSMKGR